MSSLLRTQSNGGRTPVLESISDHRRRHLLDVLLESASPLRVDELVERLAGAERNGVSAASGPTRAGLLHDHLPALESAGLVEWNRDANTVSTTDHPVFDDPAFGRILDGESDELDAVLESLANECRSTALAILDERDGSVDRRTLGREIAGTLANGAPTREAIGEVLVALHHLHLPKLEDAGLVEYDRDEETVTYRGHPALEAGWFDHRFELTSGC